MDNNVLKELTSHAILCKTESKSQLKQQTSQDSDVSNETSSLDWSEFEGYFEKEFHGSNDLPKTAERFLQEIFITLLIYIRNQRNRAGKVVDFHHPHQLMESMSHCLDIDEKPRDLEQILSDCKETLKYCVKTGHPRFLNQLSTGMDIVGMAGEWLTAVTNTNMFTYEVAPVFTLIEDVLIQKMIRIIGWDDGEGLFTPGGSISNLYGVLLARHRLFPDIKQKGLYGSPKLIIFTSEQSHYSIGRAACTLGIGLDNVAYIECDHRGKMYPFQLEKHILKSISDGSVPLMVNATCGTTVLGAYDNLIEIADICDRYNIWLHVDGAWGGGALLSNEHRHFLNGIQRADSMTWNPHKMMGAPLQCSAILVKQKGLLRGANEMRASYLFQPDKWYDVTYDTGDKTLQCGRHNDVFKLWLMWRAKGDAGFEEQINRYFTLSRYLLDQVKSRQLFEPVLQEIEGPSVSFWVIPPHIKEIIDEDEKRKNLHLIAPKLKAAMMEKGSMMVTYQPLGALPNFFRIVISNQNVNKADLDFVLKEMEHLTHEL